MEAWLTNLTYWQESPKGVCIGLRVSRRLAAIGVRVALAKSAKTGESTPWVASTGQLSIGPGAESG